MIGNKIADKIMNVERNLQQNKSETFTNGNDEELPKRKKYISRKKARDYWWSEINIIV